MVAQAANVSPVAIAIGDPTALDSVRKSIESRVSAESSAQQASSEKLALFDKGVAAVREARAAKTAAAAQSATSNDIREHRALGDLYQYGRTLGMSETGTNTQALAWLIAVHRFEDVSSLPKQQKSYAAEPLFSVLLDVPAPVPTGGRTAATWNEYLAAAARTVGATSAASGTGRAVGGGPAATDEKANLREVARSVEDRMQRLVQQLPASSPLRPDMEAAIADVRNFEAQASTSQPSTSPEPSGAPTSGSKKTTPKKQHPTPKQDQTK
jgi:hypothetical protein